MALIATHISWSKFGYLVTIVYSITKDNMWLTLKVYMVRNRFYDDTYP